MALMKWGKYNYSTEYTYYNDHSTGVIHVWRYESASSNLYGYDDWGFSESQGYYETGICGAHPTIFTNSTTSLYWKTISVEGDTYYVDIYLVRECDYSTEDVKGSFVEEVVAEAGTYPTDGTSGAYWYVLIGAAFFTMKCEIDSVLKTGVDGWCKIDGTLKKIAGGWIKVDGVLKQLK